MQLITTQILTFEAIDTPLTIIRIGDPQLTRYGQPIRTGGRQCSSSMTNKTFITCTMVERLKLTHNSQGAQSCLNVLDCYFTIQVSFQTLILSARETAPHFFFRDLGKIKKACISKISKELQQKLPPLIPNIFFFLSDLGIEFKFSRNAECHN